MNYDKTFENMAKALRLGESIDPEQVGGVPEARPRQVELTLEQSLRTGTIAGKESPRLLDTREHFPVTTKVQAQSAISRSKQLADVPIWYRGDISELRDDVYQGAIAYHPELAIALSDGETPSETTPKSVENPADIRKNDTKSKRPTITTALLLSECEDDDRRIAIAGNLMDNLEKQKKNLEIATKVASRLLKKGLTSDEFAGLISYYQEDILRELLMTGTTAGKTLDRRDELIAKMQGAANKNDPEAYKGSLKPGEQPKEKKPKKKD
jgi:hypothetical protein